MLIARVPGKIMVSVRPCGVSRKARTLIFNGTHGFLFKTAKLIHGAHFPLRGNSGTVYTDAVSFVTASVSMRLRLSFTRRRSSSLSEPCRFEYAFKSGAFSKRYGFEVV